MLPPRALFMMPHYLIIALCCTKSQCINRLVSLPLFIVLGVTGRMQPRLISLRQVDKRVAAPPEQTHSPVHFVVRDDGNDGGDADAVRQAVPEERPAGEPPCLVKEQRWRLSSKATVQLHTCPTNMFRVVPWRPGVRTQRRCPTGCRLLTPRWCSPQCLPLSQTHLTNNEAISYSGNSLRGLHVHQQKRTRKTEPNVQDVLVRCNDSFVVTCAGTL